MKALFLFLGGWLLLAPVAQASWRDALPEARVLGSGDFRFWGMRVYTARLWGAFQAFAPDQPFALELTYHRSIRRQTLVDTSIEEIRRLRGAADEVQLAKWRRQMEQAFVDVQPGQRIIGVYLPGRGCRFYVGDRLSAAVDSPAFARAFFDIWLDPRTRNPELRERLLGSR